MSDWDIVAPVGGMDRGPLHLSANLGPTPTGNFIKMIVNGEEVYGKLSVPGDDSAAYLAINRAAAQAATPAEEEAAFLNPNNWKWKYL